MPSNEIAVLFSGGTDSSLATALCVPQFAKIHLLTFKRFGISQSGNSAVKEQEFKAKYGPEKFTHHYFDIGPIFKHLSYEHYLRNVRKHRLFLLSTCGFCKLAMHVRAILFCLEHGVTNVADGANRGMDLFPDQIRSVIALFRDLYAEFGIDYQTPVFDIAPTPEKKFLNREQERLLKIDAPAPAAEQTTTGELLYRMGLAPASNIKGSAYDRQRQAHCQQLLLFLLFAKNYYLPRHSYADYVSRLEGLFQDKCGAAREYIECHRPAKELHP